MVTKVNNLGIDKPPSKTRVVVAMSGGVDSAVVADKLQKQNYEVIGITLQLYSSNASNVSTKTCCAGQDIHDARRVAASIGIPHYVFDYEKRFKEKVIGTFVSSYMSGQTPVPCIQCNQSVKFSDLLDTARELGADVMATGHYARIEMGCSGPELYRAIDAKRDQSYFLFSTTSSQLDFLRFPLGHVTKSDARAWAAESGLLVADKPDSQDICFVPDGNYAAVIERQHPGAAREGDIVNTDGEVLGRHRGIIYYTVGQRRGLGLAGPDPYYVVRLEPDTDRVVVGRLAEIMVTEIELERVNWLVKPESRKAAIKVRSTQQPMPARILCDQTIVRVQLEEAEAGVAPGQACVFYDGDLVLGGGWISRAN